MSWVRLVVYAVIHVRVHQISWVINPWSGRIDDLIDSRRSPTETKIQTPTLGSKTDVQLQRLPINEMMASHRNKSYTQYVCASLCLFIQPTTKAKLHVDAYLRLTWPIQGV